VAASSYPAVYPTRSGTVVFASSSHLKPQRRQIANNFSEYIR